MLHYSLPQLELKTEPAGVIEGYASAFGVKDAHGDLVQSGAFHDSLQNNPPPSMLWSHDQSQPIGRWVAMTEDSKGLHVVGQLNMKTTAGTQAFEHINGGDIGGLSIGFTMHPDSFRLENGYRVLEKIDLREVSVVSIPSNPQARITSVKSLSTKPATLREFESALSSIGFSRREATNLAKKGWTALSDDSSDELSQALERIRAASLTF